MRTHIYYFSGTGNSLVAARRIADRLGTDLVSISKAVEQDKIHVYAERIGIIFPSYLAALTGLPLIVERFIRKIDDIGSLYVFGVCTCGGHECVNALPALHRLRDAVRSCGGRLSAEYSIRLPMNNLDYDHIPVPIERDQESIIRRSESQIDRICDRIIRRKGTSHRISKDVFSIMMEPAFRLMRKPVINALRERAKEPETCTLHYDDLIHLTDRSITVDNCCIGCGTCVRVCPVHNIKLVDNKPQFQHRCEMCFACDEWCPRNAIHHWSRAKGIKYHHPEVSLSDML